VRNRIALLETVALLLQQHGQDKDAHQFSLLNQNTGKHISDSILLSEVNRKSG
jgi:putative lipoic acid-binding regulatory protein